MRPRETSPPEWMPVLTKDGKPKYISLADRIENDIKSGVLSPGDRLPPQRVLSDILGVDFTTVSRGYAEAKRRSLIDSQVGSGTFVKKEEAQETTGLGDYNGIQRTDLVDLRYNLPPEPSDPKLIARMQNGISVASQALVSLLRYQNTRASELDNSAVSAWLGKKGLIPNQSRVLISPGAHPAIVVVLRLLAKPGDVILSEDVSYPGIRSIAQLLGLNLIGLSMDNQGIMPDALEDAIKRHGPKALYLNPTLQNPTTLTISESRRAELAHVLQKYGLQLIEDDAYGFVSNQKSTAFAQLVSNLTWYVSGLSKCLGAGLRLAYVIAPNAQLAFKFSSGIDALAIMPSPLTTAIASQWILDGTADEIRAFLRRETEARQAIAKDILGDFSFRADPNSFNIWIHVADLKSQISNMSRFATAGLGISTGDIFAVNGQSCDYLRICLGGPLSRERLITNLHDFAHMFQSDMVFG